MPEIGIRRVLPGATPNQDKPVRTMAGGQPANPLLTNPLTPFLLLRVFLTSEGSDANFVPANFDPSLAPQKHLGTGSKMANCHILFQLGTCV